MDASRLTIGAYYLSPAASTAQHVRRLGTQTYDAYIDRYVRCVDTPHICFDLLSVLCRFAGPV